MAETSLECINRNLIGSLNVVTLCIEYSSRVQMCQADSACGVVGVSPFGWIVLD